MHLEPAVVQYFRKEVWKPAGLTEAQLRRLVDLDAQYGHLQVTQTLSRTLSPSLPLSQSQAYPYPYP